MRTSSTHIATHLFRLITGALALMALLGLSACSDVQIEWVNFVRFGGITYVAKSDRVGRLPTDVDRGPVFATVHFRLDGTVHDPH